MTINLSFSELSDYIREHYGKTLAFSRLSDNEVCIAYEQHILFRTIQVPINISIHDVQADTVTITYGGGFGIDMIIAGVFAFLRTKLPELSDALNSEEGHRIRIILSNLQQTASLVNAFNLRNIIITNNGLEITGLLK